jgi:FkbM family methyltransferase
MEKTYAIRIGGSTYEMVSDDDYLAVHKDGFEPAMVHLFQSLVTPQSNVLDIGANVGCTTLLFGSLARRVISFEPSPSTFGFLQRNVAASGLSNIAVENYGLGNVAQVSQLTYAPNNRAGAFVSSDAKASRGHTSEAIRIKRLDDVVDAFELPHINFVKIDTEGFEKNVLEGARTTIARYLPLVVLELNHWCLNAFQRVTIPDFFDFLRAMFPIVLAVDNRRHLDIGDSDQRYQAMYQHINHKRFPNILAAFDRGRLKRFLEQYPNG